MHSQIDFHSKENHLLLNPKFDNSTKEFFKNGWNFAIEKFDSHIGIATSGTSSSNAYPKLVLLSKAAFLASAQAVNRHLKVNESDIWLKALPEFHVGGLSILARASLSQSKVYEYSEEKWSPLGFFQSLKDSRATFISLVPTQIFDLLSEGLRAPAHLKAVLIGGAALSDSIYNKAKQFGWRLLPSYGMTETCSMIACADPGAEQAKTPKVLSHAEVRLNPLGQIEISASSLLTAYIMKNEDSYFLMDPKVRDQSNKAWFCSEDFAELNSGGIQILGRGTDFVKVGGEGVSLLKLENILSQLRLEQNRMKFDMTLVAVPDDRLGHRVDLLSTANSLSETQSLVDSFNQRVMGFEKIREIHLVKQIPRTELGKVKNQEALELIMSNPKALQS